MGPPVAVGSKVIGVFDSGVGGLTVLRAIFERSPGASTVYLGDTARVPYGTRSADTVTRYASNAARMLREREDLSVLVVACNTASAVALDTLRAASSIPVIGVIEPTARYAASLATPVARAHGRPPRIGVIGTPGTIESGTYQKTLRRLVKDGDVLAIACPLFVPLAEEGWTAPDDPIPLAIAERYLAVFRDFAPDALILGCTHYPLLAPVIHRVLPEVRLADAAAAVAEEVAGLVENDGRGLERYYVTDRPQGFSRVAERFLGRRLAAVVEVDL